jgi:dTDP-D-glucose 4,6-dehydratase
MDNREKIVRIVAEKLNVSPTVVREAVRLQMQIIKETMQKDKMKTGYFRKVGHFIHADLRYQLKAERIKRSNKSKPTSSPEENIIEFD